jgi:hypothetical protein
MAINNFLVKTISGQIKQDLLGKDAFRGVTLSYTWLANQFGHFALGLIPAAIWYSISASKKSGATVTLGSYIPTFAIWLIWFGFEVFNHVSTISKRKKDSAIVRKAKENFYDPRKWHFRNDWFTDICFFFLGAVAARFLFIQDMYTVLTCCILIPMLVYEFIYWYPSKIYLQRALYPFQYRLSQWTRNMSDKNKDAVNLFMQSGFSGTQLLVLGEDDDEKIHLCVGIGSEVSYQLKKCRYLTAMKAFECFYRHEAEDSPTAHQFCWNWEEAELLIIDDINPSHTDIREVITTDEFLQKIDDKHGEENRKLLREKKVIWMLGNETPGKPVEREWKEMLVKIGVDPTNIITINLSESKPML